MPRDIPERDWKVFKELRAIALERFCHRVLGDTGRLMGDSAKSSYDRYSDVYRLITARDRELARVFDAPRRSRALVQLAQIANLDLLEPEELTRISPEVRDTITELRKAFEPRRVETREAPR